MFSMRQSHSDLRLPSDVAAHHHAAARLAFFGLGAVTFRHAMVRALRKVRASTSARRTDVAPRRPQVPLIGVNIVGSAATSICCCSGASFTMPQSLLGYPRVAKKTLPPARKS